MRPAVAAVLRSRIATVGVPPFMGLLVELHGMEASFAITGGIVLAICAGLSLVAMRMQAFRDS